jgi:hypothetical protein
MASGWMRETGLMSEFQARERATTLERQKWKMDQSHLDYNPCEPMGIRETRADRDVGK